MSTTSDTLPIIHQMAIYDPRHLPETDFLNSFVGRQKELQHLLQQVKFAAGENKHHLLIYGSRGMGKTSMLRRIAIAIRDDEDLKKQWIPVNFREEQYNVRQLSFFWKNTADAVAEWCEQVGDMPNVMLLDNAQDNQGDADELWSLLHKVSQQHGARLLLLVDNLNLILQNLSEQDQWGLRKILSQPDGPMMIAATTTLIKELTQRDAPFYDYFQLQDLVPLSAAELRTCLLRIARSRGELGQHVITEINQQPARLQVLHTLTNGNPRTLFHIYQILESLNGQMDKSSNSIMSVLESLLDSVTPLYKARTEELTLQQRQVLDAIALAWDPKSSAWIANQTQLNPTTLSPQLKRLRELGIIEEVSLADNKKGLQLRERFYNIWYLLRNGSRRGRQRLHFFSCFLMDWYSPTERHNMARDYLKAERKNLEYSLALADTMDNNGLQRALLQGATLEAIQSNELLDDILSKELDSAIMDSQQQKQDVYSSLQNKGWTNKNITNFWQLLSGNLTLTLSERQQVINAIASSSEPQLMELLAHWQQQKIPYAKYFSDALIAMLKEKQQQGFIRDYQDIDGFLAIFEQSDDKAVLLFPLLSAPNLATEKIPESYIILALDEMLKQASSAEGWFNLAYLLHTHLFRYDEAEQAYRKAIELDPKRSYPWTFLGVLLQNHQSRYNEAEQAYHKAIELDPKDSYSWNFLGNLLQNHLSRYKEAEQAYRQAIQLDPKGSYSWNNLGNLLQDHLSRYKEAEQTYLKAKSLDKGDLTPTSNLCWLAIQQKQIDKAQKLYQQLDKLPKVGKDLLDAALLLSTDNFGNSWTVLQTVLNEDDSELWVDFRDDLLRLVRLFKQYQYGERLLEAMQQAGFAQTIAPFHHAVEASVYGEALLKNINPEVRGVAESMFRWIESAPIIEI
ncbi:MAG: tetratricopeptide repeat protein [Methyloprofundus sp.]|nr:tetratricopeptide repeat protein [Methyloprofundus sp.]